MITTILSPSREIPNLGAILATQNKYDSKLKCHVTKANFGIRLIFSMHTTQLVTAKVHGYLRVAMGN